MGIEKNPDGGSEEGATWSMRRGRVGDSLPIMERRPPIKRHSQCDQRQTPPVRQELYVPSVLHRTKRAVRAYVFAEIMHRHAAGLQSSSMYCLPDGSFSTSGE